MRVSIALALALLASCQRGDRGTSGAGSGSGSATSKEAAPKRSRCLQVADHLVGLMMKAYASDPKLTFDGLNRSDPQITEGLDPAVTRDTFGDFLATDAGEAWMERQKLRALASVDMTTHVDNCTTYATEENLACWLGARNWPAFQLCPPPEVPAAP